MTALLTNNAPVLIPTLLLGSALLLPAVARKRKQLAWPYVMIVAAISLAFSIFNVVTVLHRGPIHYRLGDWVPPIGIEYVLDHLSAFVMLVINTVALLVLSHSRRIVEQELPKKQVPYFTAILLMLCGFNGIVITGDLFNLYVFLEISSLSLYGLIAVGERQSPVAAFRYLIMGTIAASFYLLGIGFLYMETGSLNMADVKNILPTLIGNPGQIGVFIALSMVVVGMGIKMALFPMHNWLPDAYTYAPSTSSAIIAPTGTKVGAYVLLRVMFFVFGVNIAARILPIADIITWLAAIAIIYGSILAIAQKEMKRMLAYSSVAQIGYIALGIGLANPLGIVGAVLHVLNHAFMKACLFLVAGNFRYKLKHSNIDKFNNSIRKKMPWTMAAFTVAALSMVGVPPMAGFFSKWYLVLAAIKNSGWVFLGVILLSSLLNAVYFFRILEKVYMRPRNPEVAEKEESEDETRDEAPASMIWPTLVTAAAIIILGLANAFIVKGILQYIVPPGM